jgi:hypothetical protein
LQTSGLTIIGTLAAGLALSACAAGLPTAGAPTTGGTPAASATPATSSTPASSGLGLRDLSPAEKKVIMDAVAENIKDPASAKYHWTRFPALVTDNSVNYCATVDAKSPYAPYDGRQAYIVEVKLSGEKVTSATMGLIAGGKDFGIVSKMCAKYGLDPNKAM